MRHIYALCHCVASTFHLLTSKYSHTERVKISLYVAMITYDHLSMLFNFHWESFSYCM